MLRKENKRVRAEQDLIPKGLRTEQFRIERGGVTISVASVEPSARCPVCERSSRRVHSRYARKLADLPWHGAPVVLRAGVRRFFCDEASCERRIFCERLPKIAARARKTGRLDAALLAIVLELGGRAGAKLARSWASWSAATHCSEGRRPPRYRTQGR